MTSEVPQTNVVQFSPSAKWDDGSPIVVEDLPGGTVVELQAAAPIGVTGQLVVDLGLVEV